VARTLERRWEEALVAERCLADEHDRFCQEKPLRLSREDRERIEQLAADIPRLWQAEQTTVEDRKAIIRHLVEEVVVHVRKEDEYTDVMIRWQGGITTRHEIRRTVRDYKCLRDYDRLLERVTALWEEKNTPEKIAEILNEEGYLTPRRRGPFNRHTVCELLHKRGIGPDKRSATQLGENEWWPKDLAEVVGVPVWKMEFWADWGWVHCRKTPIRKWRILWADAEEVARLKKLRARSRHGCNAHPAELITPKKRKET
jgi:hypothetical protein